MTTTALILAAALAAGHPFGTVTPGEYADVHHGQSRHHVEHAIFDDVTGIVMKGTRWVDDAGRIHVVRSYRETDGRLIEVSYRKRDAGARFRVVGKSRGTE